MANLGKRDGGQQGGAQKAMQRSEPQRGELRRDPYQELMRDPFRLFARDPWQIMREMMMDPWRMYRGMGRYGGGFEVGFDVRETDDAFIFKADLPGMRAEDIDISLAGNQLRIRGNRQHEEEQEQGQLHTYERSYGSFSRSFSLPESADLDKVRCDLEDGVLSLVVPKKPGASPKRRKIQIGGGSKS